MIPARPLANGAALGALLLAAGCRLATLPPPSSRTDGGPVASRGVITHEARSQVRLYRDAAGCQSVQTVNRVFRLVTVLNRSGPERLVLEEEYDVRRCLESGSASSEAQITAWRPAENQPDPIFRIRSRGGAGEPAGNLYRIVSQSCCGSGDLATWYSLLSGRLLFTTSARPLRLDDTATRDVRFVAFHDTFSAAPPPEAARDSTVAGVLQVAGEREPGLRLVVTAPDRRAFAVTGLAWVREGRVLPDSVAVLPGPARAPLAVRVSLATPPSAPGPRQQATVELPFEGLVPRPERARITGGVALPPTP